MPDFHGPIERVLLARALWTLLAPSALAAITCAWMALTGRKNGRFVARISIGATALAFASSVAHAALLATKPESDRFLLEHLWRMVRIGQLDASFDLALDTLSSTTTLVVTGIGLPIFVFAASYMKDDDRLERFFAWMNGFVLAMLVLVLADGFVLLFFGWEGVGLCSWGLIGFWWRDRANVAAGKKAFLVNRVGDAAFVLGVALLYWGLGGSWADGDYVPDLSARFASVEVRDAVDADEEAKIAAPAPAPAFDADEDEDEERALAAPPARGEGFLTLTSYSGAVVFMDDARTPLKDASGAILHAPFVRLPVRPGIHSFRIHPGEGLDDFLVTHVGFGEGREIALASFGPSVTFRNVRDQLVARDASGRRPFLESLLAKRAWGNASVVTVACLLLFAGCCAKSAQLPLFVWLPDAMAGPTPVSALLHAATMVTAGVYLLARLSFLFVLSREACTVVAIVGASTALLAGTMGLYQYDVKRVLAYSTVSQLGFMVLACGVGAYDAGIFHVVTHACFKALLFLAAGATIHALHGADPDRSRAQDLRHMGGLARVLPKTSLAYRIGCLAITAAPIPGFAGFWSKDDVLVRVFESRITLVPGAALGAIALAAAGVTSFYVWRSYYLAFEGAPRDRIEEVHEAPRAMTGPLMALGLASAIAGAALGASPRFVGRNGESLLEDWLAPALRDARAPFADGGARLEWLVITAAYVVALGGWWTARARYAKRPFDWEKRERRSRLFAPSANAWWIDATYEATIVPLVRAASGVVEEIDRRVVDGAVGFVALGARVTAWIVGRADDALVDGAVRGVARATLEAGERVRAAQTGRVQTYATAIALGVLALAFLQYWVR